MMATQLTVEQYRALLHAAITIADPRQRWVPSRRPPINPAFAIAEVVWIVTARNDAAFLSFFNHQCARKAGDGPTYHGAYGHRLRHHLGIDQWQRAYDALRHKPDTRQVVLQIWDSRIDFPEADGSERSRDVPCNLVSMLKVRDGRLEWLQILRSNEVFFGLPYNIVQFTCLQEIMSGWPGIDLGAYHQISDRLHVYDENLCAVRESGPSAAVRNTDSIAVPK